MKFHKNAVLSCITTCQSMGVTWALQRVSRASTGLILAISVILRKPWAPGTQPPGPQNHDCVGKNRSGGRQNVPKCSTIVYNDLPEYEHHRDIAKCHTGPQRADFGDFRNFTEALGKHGGCATSTTRECSREGFSELTILVVSCSHKITHGGPAASCLTKSTHPELSKTPKNF